MQDKYAGDVGDFGKFTLLNQLLRANGRQLRLGINWYRVTRREPPNNDGRHISYLNPGNSKAEQFRACAPETYLKLKTLVDGDDRSIRSLERSMVLPKHTIFFSKELPYESAVLAQRIIERETWFSESLTVLKSADIIFLDPDNGILTDQVKKTQTRSIKYAFTDEVCGYAKLCDLVVVYNHRDRSPMDNYLQKFTNIQGQLGLSSGLRILRFKRVSVRDYAFFFKRGASSTVRVLFDRLAATPYDFLFEELKVDRQHGCGCA